MKAVTDKKITDATKKLQSLFATGTISLASAKAKDGDLLILRVETRGLNVTSAGIPALFEIAIKRFGAKVKPSPSLLFIKRLGLSEADLLTPA